MKSIADQDARLNVMTQQGKILEALEEFYAPECEFQEGNDVARKGRPAQHDHLSKFFATLQSFDGATLHAQASKGDITFSEWTFEMMGPDGPIVWNEILRRRWIAGRVVSERFYTA